MIWRDSFPLPKGYKRTITSKVHMLHRPQKAFLGCTLASKDLGLCLWDLIETKGGDNSLSLSLLNFLSLFPLLFIFLLFLLCLPVFPLLQFNQVPLRCKWQRVFSGYNKPTSSTVWCHFTLIYSKRNLWIPPPPSLKSRAGLGHQVVAKSQVVFSSLGLVRHPIITW